MPLNDKLRAAVFARDKGICAFSGLSLWILDYGTPLWHHDWPDHIRPVTRGGKDTLDNLVCASFFYNAKKRSNGADNVYLFKNGLPTEQYFWLHLELSAEQAEIIRRHARLDEADWYFNRALSSVCIALQLEWSGTDAVRNVDYWLRAAWKRLVIWRRMVGDTDASAFVRRGLVRFPEAPDIRLMLELANVTEAGLRKVYRPLMRHFRANANCLDKFALAGTHKARVAALFEAEQHDYATEPLRAALRSNIQRMEMTGTEGQ
jgi:hypothetical protein